MTSETEAPSQRDAIAVAAGYLERNAETLVAQWIDWVQARVRTTTISALPERALRNHVPPVLESLARYIRSPVELVREELLSHLRLHGQIRRDQGYSLKEVLAEFDGLADIVTSGVAQAIEQEAEAAPSEVLIAANRLAAGLRSVSYIAMGTYEESDEERRHTMSASLEEFARAVTHELRNPLSTLSMGLQVIRQQSGTQAGVGQQLDAMEAAVSRSAQLLDTINVLAIAEEARAGGRLVKLADALHGLLGELSERAGAAGVEIQIEDPLPEVNLEAVMVYIALANVLGNAIKYADPAKGERWVRVSAAVMDGEGEAGFCGIRVWDNGVGIPKEHVSRVCQKGFRAHPELAQGTGLGLYIVQRALLERGGSLSIDSVEHEWTAVSMMMRCLPGHPNALTAEQFSVAHLMGKSVWTELGEGAGEAEPSEAGKP